MKALAKYRIWIALLVVVLAAWWTSTLEDEATPDTRVARTSRSTSTKTQNAGSARAAQRDPAEALAVISKGFAPREAMNKLRHDPFTVVSFEPPPPPPPPPQKPVAPPLNFKYLGILREDNARAVFLDSGGQLLIARKGDALAGQYRVLEINDTNMQLEYTPLAERQTFNFGR